jgi:hypothetical protein
MRIRYLAIATLAAAAAACVAQVSPAVASKAPSSTVCRYADSPTFNSLARLAPTSTARSKGVRDKDTRGIVSDTEIPAKQAPTISASFTTTIPVYFHVITDGSTGDVSPATVDDQMTVLNLAYGGFYGGLDTGFQFELADLDYTDNADWYAQATFADELEMKAALKQGQATALNVYSTSGGDFLGWAYYPKIVVYNKYQVLDGIVIDGRSMPGGPYGSAYSLGQTLTHEAGHYLGLAHTFEQGCIGHGDYVDDTPAEATPTSGCPAGKDTCTAPGFDPIHNYMDYSYDSCYDRFTAGQAARMQTQWLHWRVKHGYH